MLSAELLLLSSGRSAFHASGLPWHAFRVHRRLRTLACVLVALAAAALLGTTPARAQVAVGDVFPSLQAAGLTGGELPATAGQVLLVDFWASWCAPCKASFPAYARLHEQFSERGLVIVAVSVDEKPAAYAAFVKKWRPPFAALLDEQQLLVRTVKVPAMPTAYLVGRDGRVRSVHQGFHGAASERALKAEIELMISEKS